jgi:hypothetical protein
MRANTRFSAVHHYYGKSCNVNPVADICANSNENLGEQKTGKSIAAKRLLNSRFICIYIYSSRELIHCPITRITETKET